MEMKHLHHVIQAADDVLMRLHGLGTNLSLTFYL